jgi:hypothetical protein
MSRFSWVNFSLPVSLPPVTLVTKKKRDPRRVAWKGGFMVGFSCEYSRYSRKSSQA